MAFAESIIQEAQAFKEKCVTQMSQNRNLLMETHYEFDVCNSSFSCVSFSLFPFDKMVSYIILDMVAVRCLEPKKLFNRCYASSKILIVSSITRKVSYKCETTV